MRAYVNDDESWVRDILFTKFNDMGIETVTQGHASVVWNDLIKSDPFDVIIIDAVQSLQEGRILNKYGGLLVAKHLRHITKTEKSFIIIISADSHLSVPFLEDIQPAIFVDKSVKFGQPIFHERMSSIMSIIMACGKTGRELADHVLEKINAKKTRKPCEEG